MSTAKWQNIAGLKKFFTHDPIVHLTHYNDEILTKIGTNL